MTRSKHVRRKRKKRGCIPGLLVLGIIALILFNLSRWVTPYMDYFTAVPDREIPLYLQWDNRWENTAYGDGTIGKDGCGPTCVAMVASGLTGKEVLPPETAQYSFEHGYLAGGATSWTFMTEGAKHFGVKAKEISLSESVIRKTLESGKPIIASMGPGDFTEKGHFIILTGIAEDGKIIVNDPNSKKNSLKTWDISVFMKQTKNLWACERTVASPS